VYGVRCFASSPKQTEMIDKQTRAPEKISKPISPALKAWLDNVIVPALTREYMAETQLKNGIALTTKLGIESPLKTVPSSEEDS